MLIITKPDRVRELTKFTKIVRNRKVDDIPRYLRILAVPRHVNVDFSHVHGHSSLSPFADFIKFAPRKSEKFSLYLPFWHFPVSTN